MIGWRVGLGQFPVTLGEAPDVQRVYRRDPVTRLMQRPPDREMIPPGRLQRDQARRIRAAQLRPEMRVDRSVPRRVVGEPSRYPLA